MTHYAILVMTLKTRDCVIGNKYLKIQNLDNPL